MSDEKPKMPTSVESLTGFDKEIMVDLLRRRVDGTITSVELAALSEPAKRVYEEYDQYYQTLMLRPA